MTGERQFRAALVGGVPWLVQITAGTTASWCSLALVVPAVWFGGTSLGITNFLVLQWFGMRLAEVRQRVLFGDDPSCFRHERWSLLRWVWPLTGWWSPVRWIARRP